MDKGNTLAMREFTKENLKKTNKMAKENSFGKTKIFTKENGKMEKNTDKEYLPLKTKKFTKEIGKKIRDMVMEC